MAEPVSASNNASVPASSSSRTGLPDWEMLSMSMSASGVAKSDAVSHPENLNPQIEGSFSQVDLPVSQENPNTDATFASNATADSLHAAVNRDDSVDIIAEPFTEGRKPHRSDSSGTHGYGAERGFGEQNRQGTETYYSSASMVVPEGSLVSAKEAACVFSYARSDDADLEHVSSKTICKGRKRPRKSSRVMWSIAVAATMVGIAVLGHQWRLACHNNQQLRLELSAKDEKLSDLLYQVNRLKDIVGGHHRVPVARSSGL